MPSSARQAANETNRNNNSSTNARSLNNAAHAPVTTMANLILPGIGHAIVNAIGDHFASAVPKNFNFGVGVTPCGIALNTGSLYLYY